MPYLRSLECQVERSPCCPSEMCESASRNELTEGQWIHAFCFAYNGHSSPPTLQLDPGRASLYQVEEYLSGNNPGDDSAPVSYFSPHEQILHPLSAWR
jgi:hypothetical protein